MIQNDITMLTDEERNMLDDSFAREVGSRRMRGVLYSTLAAVVGLVSFGQLGLSVGWFAGMAGAILIISLIEKISYQRTMLTYESMVRKLVNRIEDLEGVPHSLDDTRPSILVRKNAANDSSQQVA